MILTIDFNSPSRLRERWWNNVEMSYRQLSSFILSIKALFSSETFFISIYIIGFPPLA